MRINYCDICNTLIKTGDKKFLLGINQIIEQKDDGINILSSDDLKKILMTYQSEYKDIQIFEICKECKTVIERLLRLRGQEIKKIKDELEKTWGNDTEGNQATI